MDLSNICRWTNPKIVFVKFCKTKISKFNFNWPFLRSLQNFDVFIFEIATLLRAATFSLIRYIANRWKMGFAEFATAKTLLSRDRYFSTKINAR